jgi:hypothetical protein
MIDFCVSLCVNGETRTVRRATDASGSVSFELDGHTLTSDDGAPYANSVPVADVLDAFKRYRDDPARAEDVLGLQEVYIWKSEPRHSGFCSIRADVDFETNRASVTTVTGKSDRAFLQESYGRFVGFVSEACKPVLQGHLDLASIRSTSTGDILTNQTIDRIVRPHLVESTANRTEETYVYSNECDGFGFSTTVVETLGEPTRVRVRSDGLNIACLYRYHDRAVRHIHDEILGESVNEFTSDRCSLRCDVSQDRPWIFEREILGDPSLRFHSALRKLHRASGNVRLT